MVVSNPLQTLDSILTDVVLDVSNGWIQNILIESLWWESDVFTSNKRQNVSKNWLSDWKSENSFAIQSEDVYDLQALK